MIKAQQWLESQEKYNTKEKRNTIKVLDINDANLEGTLNLSEFANLEKLNCSYNELTDLDISECSKLIRLNCSYNLLDDLEFLTKLPHPKKLTFLNIDNCGTFLSQEEISKTLKSFVNLNKSKLSKKRDELGCKAVDIITSSDNPSGIVINISPDSSVVDGLEDRITLNVNSEEKEKLESLKDLRQRVLDNQKVYKSEPILKFERLQVAQKSLSNPFREAYQNEQEIKNKSFDELKNDFDNLQKGGGRKYEPLELDKISLTIVKLSEKSDLVEEEIKKEMKKWLGEEGEIKQLEPSKDAKQLKEEFNKIYNKDGKKYTQEEIDKMESALSTLNELGEDLDDDLKKAKGEIDSIVNKINKLKETFKQDDESEQGKERKFYEELSGIAKLELDERILKKVKENLNQEHEDWKKYFESVEGLGSLSKENHKKWRELKVYKYDYSLKENVKNLIEEVYNIKNKKVEDYFEDHMKSERKMKPFSWSDFINKEPKFIVDSILFYSKIYKAKNEIKKIKKLKEDLSDAEKKIKENYNGKEYQIIPNNRWAWNEYNKNKSNEAEELYNKLKEKNSTFVRLQNINYYGSKNAELYMLYTHTLRKELPEYIEKVKEELGTKFIRFNEKFKKAKGESFGDYVVKKITNSDDFYFSPDRVWREIESAKEEVLGQILDITPIMPLIFQKDKQVYDTKSEKFKKYKDEFKKEDNKSAVAGVIGGEDINGKNDSLGAKADDKTVARWREVTGDEELSASKARKVCDNGWEPSEVSWIHEKLSHTETGSLIDDEIKSEKIINKFNNEFTEYLTRFKVDKSKTKGLYANGMKVAQWRATGIPAENARRAHDNGWNYNDVRWIEEKVKGKRYKDAENSNCYKDAENSNCYKDAENSTKLVSDYENAFKDSDATYDRIIEWQSKGIPAENARRAHDNGWNFLKLIRWENNRVEGIKDEDGFEKGENEITKEEWKKAVDAESEKNTTVKEFEEKYKYEKLEYEKEGFSLKEKQKSKSESLPLRLYDIKNKKVEEETEGRTDIKNYAILSYVWGSGSGGRKWEKGKQLNYLNTGGKKALAKAIKTCEHLEKYLKIDYLWMDQLCINQNGENKEKKQEVPKMRQYYSNAAATLVSINGNLLEENGSLPSLPDTLKKIISSDWFTRTWIFQEGWLSKNTIFMFDDYLVDGRAIAQTWVLNQPVYTKFAKYNSLEEATNASKKIATPLGWTYYKGEYDLEDEVNMSLGQVLKEIKNRGRTANIDGIYGILGLLPYGKDLKFSYKSRICPECEDGKEKEGGCNHKEKNKEWPIYDEESIAEVLYEVMKIAVAYGYGEPLAWHGEGSGLIPRVINFKNEDKIPKGSVDAKGGLVLICKCERKKDHKTSSNCKDCQEENFPHCHENNCVTIKDIKIKENGIISYGDIEIWGTKYVITDNIKDSKTFGIEANKGFLIEGGLYKKSVKVEGIDLSLIGSQKTLESIGKENKGDYLIILDKDKWESESPFAMLVGETNENSYYRKGIVGFDGKPEVKKLERLGVARESLIIKNEYSIQVSDIKEVEGKSEVQIQIPPK